MKSGILGGCPVVGVYANVYDGSYHEVDSSEMAFHIAGSLAFKDAMKQGAPVLLEPIMKVEVTRIYGRYHRRPELTSWTY